MKHILETLVFQSQPKVSYNFLAERLISENLGIFVIKIIITVCFEVRTIVRTVNKGKIALAEMLKNNNSKDVLELKNPENNNNNISQKQEKY